VFTTLCNHRWSPPTLTVFTGPIIRDLGRACSKELAPGLEHLYDPGEAFPFDGTSEDLDDALLKMWPKAIGYHPT
jgi:hypothetical protein